MAKGVSIKVSEELLRDIHAHAARKGVSTQQYMNTLIERELFPERFPQLTGEAVLPLIAKAWELPEETLA